MPDDKEMLAYFDRLTPEDQNKALASQNFSTDQKKLMLQYRQFKQQKQIAEVNTAASDVGKQISAQRIGSIFPFLPVGVIKSMMDNPEMYGGMAGGILGGPLGAVAGGAIGESGKMATEILQGKYLSPSDITKRLFSAGAIQGAYEVPGMLFSGARSMSKAARGLMEELGISYPAATEGNSKLLGTLLRGSERSLLGSVAGKTAEENTVRVAGKAVNDAISQLGQTTSPQSSGVAAQNALQVGMKAFRKWESSLWDRAMESMKDVMVDIRPVKAALEKASQENLESKFIFPRTGGYGSSGQKIIDDVVNNEVVGDFIPLKVAKDIKTNWNNLIPDPTDSLANKTTGLAKLAASEMDKAINSSIKSSASPEAQRLYSSAKNFTKAGHKIFDEKFFSELVNKDPSAVVSAIETPTEATVARQAILGYGTSRASAAPKEAQTAWENMTKKWVETKIFKSPMSGKMNIDDLRDMSSRLGSMNPETLNILFGYSPRGRMALQNLRRISNATKYIEKMPSVSDWRIMEVMVAGGSMLGTATSLGLGHPGIAASFASLEPLSYGMTKLMYSPRATTAFVNSLYGISKSTKSIPTILRAYEILKKEDQRESEAQKNKMQQALPSPYATEVK